MRHKYMTVIILLVAAMLLASCAGGVADQPNQIEDKANPVGSETESESIPADPSQTPEDESPDISEERPTQPPVPMTGEVPEEIMDQIFADLMKSTDAERDDIHVVRAEAVVWNDGSLGCPKPGEFYIQMMINGYWVVLESKGVYYDYRASDAGNFKLCEGENLSPIPPSEPGDQTNNPLVEQAKEDLAARSGIQTSEIELLKYEEVVWPDSSLGCPQPGMEYLQVPMDGALIRLSAGGQAYNYHSGGNRGVFLCEIAATGTKSPPKIDLVPPPGSADE